MEIRRSPLSEVKFSLDLAAFRDPQSFFKNRQSCVRADALDAVLRIPLLQVVWPSVPWELSPAKMIWQTEGRRARRP
jgi:hypothetical protein